MVECSDDVVTATTADDDALLLKQIVARQWAAGLPDDQEEATAAVNAIFAEGGGNDKNARASSSLLTKIAPTSSQPQLVVDHHNASCSSSSSSSSSSTYSSQQSTPKTTASSLAEDSSPPLPIVSTTPSSLVISSSSSSRRKRPPKKIVLEEPDPQNDDCHTPTSASSSSFSQKTNNSIASDHDSLTQSLASIFGTVGTVPSRQKAPTTTPSSTPPTKQPKTDFPHRNVPSVADTNAILLGLIEQQILALGANNAMTVDADKKTPKQAQGAPKAPKQTTTATVTATASASLDDLLREMQAQQQALAFGRKHGSTMAVQQQQHQQKRKSEPVKIAANGTTPQVARKPEQSSQLLKAKISNGNGAAHHHAVPPPMIIQNLGSTTAPASSSQLPVAVLRRAIELCKMGDDEAQSSMAFATDLMSTTKGRQLIRRKIFDGNIEAMRAAVAALTDQEQTELAAIDEFASNFKKQRIKFGFTQGDVGAALGRRYGTDFSQTTISRFEALNLSYKNMCKLRPMLREWLEDIEAAIARGIPVAELVQQGVDPLAVTVTQNSLDAVDQANGEAGESVAATQSSSPSQQHFNQANRGVMNEMTRIAVLLARVDAWTQMTRRTPFHEPVEDDNHPLEAIEERKEPIIGLLTRRAAKVMAEELLEHMNESGSEAWNDGDWCVGGMMGWSVKENLCHEHAEYEGGGEEAMEWNERGEVKGAARGAAAIFALLAGTTPNRSLRNGLRMQQHRLGGMPPNFSVAEHMADLGEVEEEEEDEGEQEEEEEGESAEGWF